MGNVKRGKASWPCQWAARRYKDERRTWGGGRQRWPVAPGTRWKVPQWRGMHMRTPWPGRGVKAGDGRWCVGQCLLHLFIYFPILQIFPNIEIQLNCPAAITKIFKLCTRLELNILNNFLNRVDFKFPTKTTLKFSSNFSGVQTFGENLVNLLKFFLNMIFHNVNLYWLSWMNNLEVPLQVVIMTWFNNLQMKDLNLNLNIKPRHIVLHYRGTVEHCSQYSDTRGVTLFLDFSLSYPHSLHHSPSTMIICHTSSLEFSFAFTIYKV
jgi:hypothetical protein